MASLPPGVDLCAIPAAIPPKGVIPNFINPTSLAPATISICIILTAWAVSFIVTRLYINWQKLNIADYFMVMAAVMTITYTGLIVSLNRYNRHQWDVPACWLDTHYLRVIYSHTTIVGAVLFFPKCAIFLMYRQLFYINLKFGIWFGLIFCFCIYFPSIPLSAIYEAPRVGHTWTQLLESLATSTDQALVWWGVVQGSCSVALDLFIFILPLRTLSRLQMPPRRKYQLVALFATALFGVIASVIALYFRVQNINTKDSTWNQARLAICVVVENNVAIVVGCMPAFANFVRSFSEFSLIQTLRSRFRNTAKDSSGSGSGGTLPLPNTGTLKSPTRKKPSRHYYELTEHPSMTDTNITKTNFDSDEQPGIMRTVDIVQKSQSATTLIVKDPLQLYPSSFNGRASAGLEDSKK